MNDTNLLETSTVGLDLVTLRNVEILKIDFQKMSRNQDCKYFLSPNDEVLKVVDEIRCKIEYVKDTYLPKCPSVNIGKTDEEFKEVN